MKASRAFCTIYLSVTFLLSIGLLFLAYGMEGMRHSKPKVGEFDPYYWKPTILVTLMSYLLGAAYFSMKKKVKIYGLALSSMLAAVVVYLNFDDTKETILIVTLSTIIALIAHWHLITSQPSKNRDKNMPNQAAHTTAVSAPR